MPITIESFSAFIVFCKFLYIYTLEELGVNRYIVPKKNMQRKNELCKNDISSGIVKYVRVKQAAEFLGVSPSHIYRLAERRLIPHFKSKGGKVIYFSLADLEDYITDTRVTPVYELEEEIVK